MPLAQGSVSAFATYSGLGGSLSKKQRQRRNKKKNKINSAASFDISSANKETTDGDRLNKKRKSNKHIKVEQKLKKQKLNDSVREKQKLSEEAKERQELSDEAEEEQKLSDEAVKEQKLSDETEGEQKLSDSEKERPNLSASVMEIHNLLLKWAETKVRGLSPKKLSDLDDEKKDLSDEEEEVQINGDECLKKKKIKKMSLKKKKVINKNTSMPMMSGLLTKEQVKLKLGKRGEKTTGKKVTFRVEEMKERKISNNLSLDVPYNEIIKQHTLTSPTELVGKVALNQENKDSLISKINKTKNEFQNLINAYEHEDIMLNNLRNSEDNGKEMFEKMIKAYESKMLNNLSSADIGQVMFQKMIAPYDVKLFFKNHWEKTVLYIPGCNPTKFSNLMSTQLIDDYLRQQVVMFEKHIDITSYKNGQRETHNPVGRALPHIVWDLYNHKCSVRLLSPQSAFTNVFAMNSKLQEYFGCFVGANAYLTPPDSQGFAPHFDDIEAFVLQIEGQKRWKVYNPRNKYEVLPRYSSRNFKPSELGIPVMEVTLCPGDVLYFPRGFIHQADTSDTHSLHLTISVYQKTAWVDLLEKVLPSALSKAAKEDVDFRRGLPLKFLSQAGMAYNTQESRKALVKSVKMKIAKLLKYIDIDKAVDMLGVQYMTDALPPVLTYEEASRCSLGNGLKMEKNGKVKGSVSFTGDTRVRFTTALCYRLVRENITSESGADEEEIRLYYSIDNSREYHGEEVQFLVVPEEYVPAIKVLSNNYPQFTAIKSLPLPTLEEKARLVGDLWDHGILMTEEPLKELDVIESEEEDIGMNEATGICEQSNAQSNKDDDHDITEKENASDDAESENADDDAENENDNDDAENENDSDDAENENDNEDTDITSTTANLTLDGDLEESSETVNDKSLRDYDNALNENERFISGNEIMENDESCLEEYVLSSSSDDENVEDVLDDKSDEECMVEEDH